VKVRQGLASCDSVTEASYNAGSRPDFSGCHFGRLQQERRGRHSSQR
jgi:hypothetical protein